MGKLIFVLVDGLRYDTAVEHMGFLEMNVEKHHAKRILVESELPSLSRPLYEVLMTGKGTDVSGITSNNVVRRSHELSIFDRCRRAGLTTAAAAYYFISELYLKAPYDELTDRYHMSGDGLIQHGIFYSDDSYPASHLFADGDFLIRTYAPDFILIHPMDVDDKGHRYGPDSEAYHRAAAAVDDMLARYWASWIDAGYRILVTADHGMGEDQMHGGTRREEREVPLYLSASEDSMDPLPMDMLPQLKVMPLALSLLGLSQEETD